MHIRFLNFKVGYALNDIMQISHIQAYGINYAYEVGNGSWKV